MGFLGFTTYRDITAIVESDFEKRFNEQQQRINLLDSIVGGYEELVETLKLTEGQSTENLNDVKREFRTINKKVASTQEALKYSTRIYVANSLIFKTNKNEKKLVQKYWFKNLRTIYAAKLPVFKTASFVFTQMKKGGVSLIIEDITKDFVELRLSQESLMLYDAQLSDHIFDMWIAEPK